jgi:hypothetical protein
MSTLVSFITVEHSVVCRRYANYKFQQNCGGIRPLKRIALIGFEMCLLEMDRSVNVKVILKDCPLRNCSSERVNLEDLIPSKDLKQALEAASYLHSNLSGRTDNSSKQTTGLKTSVRKLRG